MAANAVQNTSNPLMPVPHHATVSAASVSRITRALSRTAYPRSTTAQPCPVTTTTVDHDHACLWFTWRGVCLRNGAAVQAVDSHRQRHYRRHLTTLTAAESRPASHEAGPLSLRCSW
jgi:hypothetical protein